jgi:hypothetical protein
VVVKIMKAYRLAPSNTQPFCLETTHAFHSAPGPKSADAKNSNNMLCRSHCLSNQKYENAIKTQSQ